MSGIAAVFRFDESTIEPGTIERLTNAIAYRGPDGIAHWQEGAASLGFCALHTTAESLTAAQPLRSEDGQLVLVLDGFLHNHEELSGELRAKGAMLRSSSDAEIVLRAYETWAEDCVRRLDGEFAFVLWDGRRNAAFCARDHAGLRPLHFHWDNRRLTVASDPGAILVAPGVPHELNKPMVAQVIANEWITRGETIWKGVMRQLPATWVRFSADGMRSAVYWSPPTEVTIRYKSDVEYFEQYRALLDDCVRRSSRSHLPIASDVSGGLDSSAIFAVAENLRRQGRLLAPEIKGYTYKFDKGLPADELDYARAVAKHLGVPVQEILPFFPDLGWFSNRARQDCDMALYPNMAMAVSVGNALVRDGCRVSFNGEGGDEWVGGRAYYYAEQISERDWPALARSFREDRAAIGLRAVIYRLARFGILPQFPDRLISAVHKLVSPKGPNTYNNAFWLAAELDQILSECREANDRSHIMAIPNRSRRSMFETLQHPFLELARDQFDRRAARLGAEGRYPMFARPFIEFAFSTPECIRLRGDERKHVHVNSLHDLLPKSILERRTKADFSIAFERLFDEAYDTISGTFDRFGHSFLEPCGIRKIRRLCSELPWYERPIWELWGAYGCTVPFELATKADRDFSKEDYNG